MSAAAPVADPIAIIGAACRLPGADDVEEFWRNLSASLESISFFSGEELTAAGVPDSLLSSPNYVPARGVPREAACFDIEFFGYNSGEAELIDPQQLMFLECAWAALEDAGRPPGAIADVGVFGSATLSTHLLGRLLATPGVMHSPEQFALLVNNDKDLLCARVAHKLRLSGPAVVVQAACASSLVAIHTACVSLRQRECRVAIAGGVSLTFPLKQGYLAVPGGIHSPDGHCRSFDADAQGFVPSSGCVVVALKRLEHALQERDHIYAVIRGSAIGNDGGRGPGFVAPSIQGQVEVIRNALDSAGARGASVDLVEAHGSATRVGDPVEVMALCEAFGPTDRRGACALGSVKSNLGHLDAASGAVGVLKAALSLERETLPPSLHFHRPNSDVQLDRTPFFVCTEPRPWPKRDSTRIACVNSLGVGGTNAHAVLAEAPRVKREESESAQLLVLSGRTPRAVSASAERLRARIEACPDLRLLDVAFSLATGRAEHDWRAFVVAPSRADALSKLSSSGAPQACLKMERKPQTIFMFPGGGAQHPGMGGQLRGRLPLFAELIERLAESFRRDHGIDIEGPSEAGGEGHAPSAISALPALFSLEYALARQLIELGAVPQCLIGHSLGEYVSACIAGVMSIEDTVSLVAARSRLLDSLEPGAMLSVRASESQVRAVMPEQLDIAALNAEEATVVAGPTDAVNRFAARLADLGYTSREVAIQVGAHSRLVTPVLDAFRREVERIDFKEPTIPVVSNVFGRLAKAGELTDAGYWVKHLRSPVRFSDGIRSVLEPNAVLMELGPGHTLTGLVSVQPERPRAIVPTMDVATSRDEIQALLGALGEAWQQGASISWPALYSETDAMRVSLPAYPFERTFRATEFVPSYGREQEGASVRTDALQGRSEPSPSGPAPRDVSTEEALRQLFARLLGVSRDELRVDLPLMHWGADSLTFLRACRPIEDQLGVRISFRELMQQGFTVGDLASLIEERRRGASPGAALESGAARTTTVPFPRVRTERLPGLGGNQMRALSELTSRVQSKTRSSKDYAEKYRPVLADNRMSAGFAPEWKELVYPLVVKSARGSRIVDIQGNEYVDIAMGFGVHLFGHLPSFISSAMTEAIETGIGLGPQGPEAGIVASLIAELTGVERVAFTNSGTEAVMTAIRLARAVTRRSKVVVFEGSYHGFYDGTLGQAGFTSSNAEPAVTGVTPGAVHDLVVMDFASERTLDQIAALGDEIAAVLVEPVQSRRPSIRDRAFLAELRRITSDAGASLIFDEIVTGFRTLPGGAQQWFDVRADLVTYGKVVGGGLPIGVVAGRRAYMDALDGGAWRFGDDSRPEVEQTFFAGTFCKHPLTMAAAKAVLLHLREQGPQLQNALNARTERMASELNQWFEQVRLPLSIEYFSSLFRIKSTVPSIPLEPLYFEMLDRGVYTWEGRNCFLSTAHTDEDISRIETTIRDAASRLEGCGLLPRRSMTTARAPTSAPERAVHGSAERFPLTMKQMDLLSGAAHDVRGLRAYNESATLRLEGPLDVVALVEAIQMLAMRHDALRTVIDVAANTQLVLNEPRTSTVLVDLEQLALPESEQWTWSEALSCQDMNLEQGPLFVATIGRVRSDVHFLVLTAHHLISDGYSSSILIREGAEIYNALMLDREPRLKPPAQFRDYAEAVEREQSRIDESARQDYWAERLVGIPRLSLPTIGNRSQPRSWEGRRTTTVIEAPIAAALRVASAEAGTTLVAALLAAYELLLHQVTQCSEIVIGVPFAGQPMHGSEALVGMCLNVIPHRSILGRHASFFGRAVHTHGELLQEVEHCPESIARLATQVSATRDRSQPLIETIFNLDHSLLESVRFEGLAVEARGNFSGCVKCDLLWNVTDLGDVLRVDTDSTMLVDASAVATWQRQYVELLRQVSNGNVAVEGLSDAVVRVQRDAERAHRAARRDESRAKLRQSLMQSSSAIAKDMKSR